jgi:hypothetical protein
MDGITAYVGDKYANPVRPNTAVYFTSTGGIIEGSALTSIQGIGTVNLISADPRPVHPTLGKGFATVTGSTIDENLTIISYSIPVLFSGIPWINITPMTFDIPNGGSQTFNYEVKDQNDNPLSSGTSISVNVEGENVKTGGEMSINVPDTQSKGWTKFSFFIYDSVDTLVVAKKITVRITTTGPNGDAQLTISGISR